jgi:hypothetical protein
MPRRPPKDRAPLPTARLAALVPLAYLLAVPHSGHVVDPWHLLASAVFWFTAAHAVRLVIERLPAKTYGSGAIPTGDMSFAAMFP